MLKVYGHLSSGNCYKVFLALKQLEIPFDWEDVDAVKRETRTAADLERWRAPGDAALAIMDRHLASRAFLVPSATRLPTSRCMRTPMSRMKADSNCRAFRRCKRGSHASPHKRGMCR